MEPSPSSVLFVTTPDDTKIAYRCRGTGPVLVFARGWITHLDLADDDPSIRAFFSRIEQHFRVVRYDGRGNGLSDRTLPPVISLDHLVQDLTAVVDAVASDRITLWGSSWAGPAAVQFAASHPQRVERLILDGTFADGRALASPERAEAFLAFLATAQTQPHVVYASMSYLTDPNPTLSHTWRIERGRQSIDAKTLLDLHTLLYQMDVTPFLADVTCPTLVVRRSRSRSVPAAATRALVEGIADAVYEELDGESHNLWEGETAATFEALARFLDMPALAEAEEEAGQARSASLVFVDQVSSTAQMRELGDRRGVEVQAGMIRLLQRVVEPFKAEMIADTGDGLALVVNDPSDAVAAAQVIQRSVAFHNRQVPQSEAIQLRVGVHSGELLTTTGGRLSGIAFAVASRLCDQAGPGQILVSEATFESASSALGAEDFDRLERVELKGLGPVPIYEVRW